MRCEKIIFGIYKDIFEMRMNKIEQQIFSD
jgi:hypothetical protein